jgi:hypothetical protein
MTIRPIPLDGLNQIIKLLRDRRNPGPDTIHDQVMELAKGLVYQIKHQHDDEPGYLCGMCSKWIVGGPCEHIAGENREQLRARVDMMRREIEALKEHITKQAMIHKERSDTQDAALTKTLTDNHQLANVRDALKLENANLKEKIKELVNKYIDGPGRVMFDDRAQHLETVQRERDDKANECARLGAEVRRLAAQLGELQRHPPMVVNLKSPQPEKERCLDAQYLEIVQLREMVKARDTEINRMKANMSAVKAAVEHLE